MSPLAWAKMKGLEKAHEIEVSGLGIVHPDDGLLVVDLFPVEQSGTPTSTTMSPAGLAALNGRLVFENIPTELVRVFWHSHQALGVFWSGEDVNTIRLLQGDSGMASAGYVLSIVTNRKGEALGRIDLWRPIRHTIDADIEIAWEYPDVRTWVAEASKHVTAEKPFVAPPVKKAEPPKPSKGSATPTPSNGRRLRGLWDERAFAKKKAELEAPDFEDWELARWTLEDEAPDFSDDWRCTSCREIMSAALLDDYTCPICKGDLVPVEVGA